MTLIFKIIKKIIYLLILVFLGRIRYGRFLGVKIGRNCRVYISEWGTEPFLVKIGDNVTITSGVMLLTHDGSTWLVNDEKGRRYLYRRVVIKNNVFIGINTIVMPGVIIGNNVVVASGSVVTKSIPDNKIVAGNPAKIIGEFNEYYEKVMNTYVSKENLDMKIPYKQRILKVVDSTFKNDLK